jgi:hypothetical protein
MSQERRLRVLLLFLLTFSLFAFQFTNIEKVKAGVTVTKYAVTVVWDFDNATSQNWFAYANSGYSVNASILTLTYYRSSSYAIHGVNQEGGNSTSTCFGLGTWNTVCSHYLPQTIWTFPSHITNANITFWSQCRYAYDANSKLIGAKLATSSSSYIWDSVITGQAINFGTWVQSPVWDITSHVQFNSDTQLMIKIGLSATYFASYTHYVVSDTDYYDDITLKYDYTTTVYIPDPEPSFLGFSIFTLVSGGFITGITGFMFGVLGDKANHSGLGLAFGVILGLYICSMSGILPNYIFIVACIITFAIGYLHYRGGGGGGESG